MIAAAVTRLFGRTAAELEVELVSKEQALAAAEADFGATGASTAYGAVKQATEEAHKVRLQLRAARTREAEQAGREREAKEREIAAIDSQLEAAERLAREQIAALAEHTVEIVVAALEKLKVVEAKAVADYVRACETQREMGLPQWNHDGRNRPSFGRSALADYQDAVKAEAKKAGLPWTG